MVTILLLAESFSEPSMLFKKKIKHCNDIFCILFPMVVLHLTFNSIVKIAPVWYIVHSNN